MKVTTSREIETANEFLGVLAEKKFRGASIVFDNDYGCIHLEGSGEFDLSEDITTADILSALFAEKGIKVHVT